MWIFRTSTRVSTGDVQTRPRREKTQPARAYPKKTHARTGAKHLLEGRRPENVSLCRPTTPLALHAWHALCIKPVCCSMISFFVMFGTARVTIMFCTLPTISIIACAFSTTSFIHASTCSKTTVLFFDPFSKHRKTHALFFVLYATHCKTLALF